MIQPDWREEARRNVEDSAWRADATAEWRLYAALSRLSPHDIRSRGCFAAGYRAALLAQAPKTLTAAERAQLLGPFNPARALVAGEVA